jgi:hypothetical protein
MLFLFDLPIDADEETKPKKDKKKFTIHIVNKEKWIIGSIILVTLLIVIGTAGVLITYRTPENISPYCKMMKEQDKICRIHDKKHTKDKLKELVIPEGEMAFHRQLAQEIEEGAYFDGDKLYGKENAEEIWAIKDNFIKEKESLFERYLASTLSQQKKERYNFLIEELETLEEVIAKLGIQSEEVGLPSGEIDREQETEGLQSEQELQTDQTQEAEPIGQIEQIDQEKQAEPIAQATSEPKEESNTQTPQTQSLLISRQRGSQVLNIPPDIEQAATIKKSSLYN